MKDFFKSFFASLLAFIAGSGCVTVIIFSTLVGSLATLATLGGDKGEPVKLSAGTVLKVNVGVLSEIVQEDPFASFFSGDEAKPIALSSAVEAIRKAKNNPNIEAIYLNVEGISAGMASIDELRNALIDFRSSGKPIIAYGDTYSQKAYYLSSVADRIVLNPMGSVGLMGIASGTLMFKGALDKLGVEMEVFRVGTFKSAVEPYLLDKMSEANRLQTQEYIDGLWASIVDGVVAERKLDRDSLLAVVDRGPAFSEAKNLVTAGLVDTLAYRGDMESIFATLLSRDAKELRMVTLNDMVRVPDVNKSEGSDVIRVLYAEGVITEETNPYGGGESTIGYSLAEDLREAADDKDIKAVVLRVNSPGGSAFLSEQIWNEVKRLRAIKPIVVSMGNLAASGGYYISAPASAIVAQPNTLTGSIGIFGLIPNASKLVSRFGINMDIVKTSRFSDLEVGLGMRPMTDDQRMLIQGEVERGYEVFLSRVAEGRGMTRDQVDSIGQGRVWLGKRAIELGLVDKLGGLDVAISTAAELAKLDSYRLDHGVTSVSFLDELLKSSSTTDDFIARLRMQFMTAEERQLLKVWRGTTQYAGIQMRLPDDFEVY